MELACSLANRHNVFINLGEKTWEASEICRLTLSIHESPNFDPKTLKVDQLITHIMFLSSVSWQPSKTADLWFATNQDQRCLARNLYLLGDNDPNSPADRVSTKLQTQFPVIHEGYLEAFVGCPIWLANNLGLSMIPRLITPHVEPMPQPTQILEIKETDQEALNKIIEIAREVKFGYSTDHMSYFEIRKNISGL